MENCKLDFNKYKDRLKEIYPSYNDEELKQVLEYRVKYWKVVIKNI